MKKALLSACMVAAVWCTSCNPQGTSHSGSGAEAGPQRPRDSVNVSEHDTTPPDPDSAGRVGDPASQEN